MKMATEYGERLLKAMAHAGINQKELVKRTGIKQSTLRRPEFTSFRSLIPSHKRGVFIRKYQSRPHPAQTALEAVFCCQKITDRKDIRALAQK